jgi:hypothetical protein
MTAWLRAMGAGLAVAIALVLASPAAAQLPEPDEDPFYAQPPAKRLAAAKPGKVLRARPVDLSASNIPVAHRAWQLQYRTADTKNRPVAAVATLIVPEEATSEPRPILSYQPAEDSLTRRCASSYELRMGSGGEPDNFSMGLQRGWAVVVPDYEGPESQWIAGGMAGHAILDAVRASQRFREAAVGRGTPVALWGYSGGGHATAWASELQPAYAPKLSLRGVAHGGASADVEATARNLDGGPASGLLLAASVGISRAYPGMRLGELLNEQGDAMAERIGDMCLEEFVAAYPFRRVSEFTDVPDPLVVPRIQRVMERVSLAQRKPGAPLYVYHSILDPLNPISASDAMVDRYCELGAEVDYHRDPASEHIALQQTGAPAAVAFLEARIAGEPAPNDC